MWAAISESDSLELVLCLHRGSQVCALALGPRWGWGFTLPWQPEPQARAHIGLGHAAWDKLHLEGGSRDPRACFPGCPESPFCCPLVGGGI